MASQTKKSLPEKGELTDKVLSQLRPGDQVFFDRARGSGVGPNIQSGFYEITTGRWSGLDIQSGLFQHPKDCDVRIYIQGPEGKYMIPEGFFSQYRLKK